MGKKIIHMVIFTLKHEKGSEEEEKFLKNEENILSSIPVVKNFKVMRQVSEKNKFDFGFSMEFSSQKEYKEYNSHPNHLAFVENRWKIEVNEFLEIDFDVIK